jgi:voltage-gated potassium channel
MKSILTDFISVYLSNLRSLAAKISRSLFRFLSFQIGAGTSSVYIQGRDDLNLMSGAEFTIRERTSKLLNKFRLRQSSSRFALATGNKLRGGCFFRVKSLSMKEEKEIVRQKVREERQSLLETLEDWLETPLLILGFVWLALLVYELIWNLSPELELLGTVIWIIFIVDFVLKFTLAPDKTEYLKANWLTALALIVPALRVFRIFRVFRVLRAARAVRGVRLFRVLTSLNRGMKSLGASFNRRGFGYVVALTGIVVFAGAAGMLAFESDVEGGIKTYGDALWWTAMMITTIGSEYFPQTAEGRVLCFILALYGFAVFGYVTATLATFFVGRDAENKDSEIVGAEDINVLRAEIAALREEIKMLNNKDLSDA